MFIFQLNYQLKIIELSITASITIVARSLIEENTSSFFLAKRDRARNNFVILQNSKFWALVFLTKTYNWDSNGFLISS